MGLGAPELLVILLVIVVLFGGKRLPELGSGIGKALANFKKGYREAQEIDISPKSPPEGSSSETKSTDASGDKR